jgi:hypothetical protein
MHLMHLGRVRVKSEKLQPHVSSPLSLQRTTRRTKGGKRQEEEEGDGGEEREKQEETSIILPQADWFGLQEIQGSDVDCVCVCVCVCLRVRQWCVLDGQKEEQKKVRESAEEERERVGEWRGEGVSV